MTVIVGRNPSPRIGRNPSPSRIPGWPEFSVAQAVQKDPSGILVDIIDHADGSFSITVDDSVIITDPRLGFTLTWPYRDPSGALLGASGGFMSALRVVTPPTAASGLVVLVGHANTADLSAEAGYSGLHYNAVNAVLRYGKDGGVTDKTDVGAVVGVADGAHTFKDGATQTLPWASRPGSYNASENELDSVGLALSRTGDWASMYAFLSVYRSSTGGGNETVRVIPSFNSTNALPGVLP